MKVDSYKTIEIISNAEFTDKSSRFIAIAFPTKSVEVFKLKLSEIKLEHSKAVHHCFAYRIGTDKNNYRSNDDGEPSGSAGKPILGQIDSFGLTNIAIVVVRYFGGILLGVPGLINAYKTVSKQALENSKIISIELEEFFLIETIYEELNLILNWAKRFGISIVSKEVDIDCKIVVSIPIQKIEVCIGELNREVKIKKIDNHL